MGDLGDGTIYEELNTILDQLAGCVAQLQDKIAELSEVRGIDDDDDR